MVVNRHCFSFSLCHVLLAETVKFTLILIIFVSVHVHCLVLFSQVKFNIVNTCTVTATLAKSIHRLVKYV